MKKKSYKSVYFVEVGNSCLILFWGSWGYIISYLYFLWTYLIWFFKIDFINNNSSFLFVLFVWTLISSVCNVFESLQNGPLDLASIFVKIRQELGDGRNNRDCVCFHLRILIFDPMGQLFNLKPKEFIGILSGGRRVDVITVFAIIGPEEWCIFPLRGLCSNRIHIYYGLWYIFAWHHRSCRRTWNRTEKRE